MTVHVKICGLTVPEDVAIIAAAGAEFIGINLVSGPRQVNQQTAERICLACPQSVRPVLLAHADGDRLNDDAMELLDRFKIKFVQLYGDLSPRIIKRLQLEGRHAFHVVHVSDMSFVDHVNRFLDQSGDAPPFAILLDSASGTKLGGTGKTADWDAIAEHRQNGEMDHWPRLMLAGGLTPDNVARAIECVKPWAVDVASGIESSPGTKCPAKVQAFIKAVREAD